MKKLLSCILVLALSVSLLSGLIYTAGFSADTDVPGQTPASSADADLRESPEPTPTEQVPPEPDPPETVSPEPDPPETVTPEPDPPETVSPEPDPPETASPEPDPTETVTPEPDPPETASPEPDPTETVTPEPDPPETVTPEPDPTETVTPEPDPTETVTPEPDPTETVTPEPDPTETASPEPDPTETVTPEPDPTETVSPEPTPPKPSYPDLGLRTRAGDSFFSDTAILGNSLIVGLSAYSNLKTPDYYCATSMSVASVMYTKDVLLSDGTYGTKLEAMAQKRYGKIYIELGINEIGFGTDYFISQYRALLNQIRAIQPDADIYIMAITPTSRAKSGTVFSKERVIMYNEALHKLAAQWGCWYLDVFTPLADSEGYLPSAETGDGIHFEPGKYRAWEEVIRTYYA